MKPHKGGQRTPAPGTRPPEYVIILWASDWAKEHDPRNRYNLWDALQAGKDNDPDPQPDLEPDPGPDLEAEP